MANIELAVPNTPQTVFRLGSVTKQFTAMAIMILQERGKLRVSDPVCQYLTDCPAAWQPLTIRHLLTHTSGIPNYTNFPDFARTAVLPDNIRRSWSACSGTSRWNSRPARSSPTATRATTCSG